MLLGLEVVLVRFWLSWPKTFVVDVTVVVAGVLNDGVEAELRRVLLVPNANAAEVGLGDVTEDPNKVVGAVVEVALPNIDFGDLRSF